MTDEERAAPSYESEELAEWRRSTLPGRRWFDDNAVTFGRHYTGSLACVPSRPTMFTGQYPDVHGVTQTDGLGKTADDSRMRWMRPGEVPTLGNWFRAAGWDTHYDGKWHISHADLFDDDGQPVATNSASGEVDPIAVQAYLDADPLAPFGFSGWVGPEPHGGLLGNAGIRRDDLIAARVCAWLEDRYARRASGDSGAMRPFLLVASFVNPHDIVLFPPWKARNDDHGLPLNPDLTPPPAVPPSPTDDDDLADRPTVQRGYRDNYTSMYAPGDAIPTIYRDHAEEYRAFYYALHAEVDEPIDRVRQAVTDHADGSGALLVRTSDHGELLGSHGGLHQKWFQLYDEAARVPFQIARVGTMATTGRAIEEMVSSHVDVVPTLLDAAGIDVEQTATALRDHFSEIHPFPGRSLMSVVDGESAPDSERMVYAMTRDHIIDGDTGLSAGGRAFGDASMRIVPLPAGPSNIEGVVGRLPGQDTLWKLVRTFDDPATWSRPFEAHEQSALPRTDAVDDEWELYDLTNDPAETTNLASDTAIEATLRRLQEALAVERSRAVPARKTAWPYVAVASPA
ncbi:MAG: sulfatase-like hydrolase/transferase [Actinomycetota bacterium]